MTLSNPLVGRAQVARARILDLRRVLGALAEATAVRPIPGGVEPPLEPRVRTVVAEQLGLDSGSLTADVSLVDDLAADSLDLAELALALEDAFEMRVPDDSLAEIRTYGELVETMELLNRRQRAAEASRAASQEPPFAWISLVRREGDGGTLERAAWLTPYTLETIVDAAVRAGPGARLEVTVPASVEEERLRKLRSQAVRLGARDLQVRIRRDPAAPPRYPDVAA